MPVSPLDSPTTQAATASENTADGLRVSVVVPVRDMGSDVRELVEVLETQRLPQSQFEVIISDDGSSSPELRALATPDDHIRVIHGPRRNSFAARNRGIAVARAPVIAVCDADCRPEPDWLERGLAAVAENDLVAGRIRFIVQERPSIWGLMDMDTFLDQERAVMSGHVVTANLFFRREWFDRVNGFDDTSDYHGDYDFAAECVAAGAQLTFADDVVVWHPTRDSARKYLRKVWAVNESYAKREARAGRKPDGLRLRSWVPIVQTARGRLGAGRSLSLDRRRLGESGIHPRLGDDLRGVTLIYLIVPYLRSIAQLRGALRGRLDRRSNKPVGSQ